MRIHLKVSILFPLIWAVVVVMGGPFCGNRLPSENKTPVTIDWLIKSEVINFQISATNEGYLYLSFSDEGDALYLAEGSVDHKMAANIGEILKACQKEADSLKFKTFGKDSFQLRREAGRYIHLFISSKKVQDANEGNSTGEDFNHDICATRGGDDDYLTDMYKERLETLVGAENFK